MIKANSLYRQRVGFFIVIELQNKWLIFTWKSQFYTVCKNNDIIVMLLDDKGDYYSSDELETKLYRYDAKNNEVKEYAGKLNELSLNRYSVISGDEGCVLRFDGKDMTKIPTSTNDFKDIVAMSVADVNIIEEYLYYEAKITKISGEVEIILARVPISGGESERINVPRKK